MIAGGWVGGGVYFVEFKLLFGLGEGATGTAGTGTGLEAVVGNDSHYREDGYDDYDYEEFDDGEAFGWR